MNQKTGKEKRAQSKQRIENLEKKIKRLRARKAAEETKLKRQAKKEDTRRKILIGAYYLNEAEKSDTTAELYRRMDGFLIRDSDRELFGLPPLEN